MTTIQCTKCASSAFVRNGKSRHGNQRYLCRSCGATVGDVDSRLVPAQLKESALKHYAQGVGLRATERLVGVSHNSVMNWVKQEVMGKALTKIDACDVQYIEADELWSDVGEKKVPFGSGGLLIVLPEKYTAGRWEIVTPQLPKQWVRRFLAALQSLTPATTGAPTTRSSKPTRGKSARPTPTP